MSEEAGSSKESRSVECRDALSATPSISEAIAELRAIERRMYARSSGPSFDQAYTWFMSLLLIQLIAIFACLMLHFQFGWSKEDLAAWAAGITSSIGLTVLGLLAYLAWLFFSVVGRVRRIGLSGLQAETIDLRRLCETSFVERLSHVPVIDLEDMEQDLAQQSSEATAKFVWTGGITALFTAASKLVGDAYGWTVATSPLLLMVAALFLGFGVGAALYLLPKPKFDRASNVVKKAIRRAKARQPKDAPSPWKSL